MTKSVEIVEVSPRDGLQNEAIHLDVAQKLELISLCVQAGARRLEAGSFVNPQKVPQMAGSDQVFAGLPKGDGVTYIALALNLRGVERALAAGAGQINYSLAASDGFAIRNNGADVATLLAAWPAAAAAARGAGIPISVTISTAFGCPFDGEIDPGRLADLVGQVAQERPFEIAMADTIGVASPRDVTIGFRGAAAAAPGMPLRAHFHNTRNTALANALAALEAGASVLDGSLGGIGGCPFAPGAAGNVPTEDLIYMLERMGISTGMDLDRAILVARWLSTALQRSVPGTLSRVPRFPPLSGPKAG